MSSSRTGSGTRWLGARGCQTRAGVGRRSLVPPDAHLLGLEPRKEPEQPSLQGRGPRAAASGAHRLRSLCGSEARGGVPGGRRSPGERRMCSGRSAGSSVAPVGGGTGRLTPCLPGGPLCASPGPSAGHEGHTAVVVRGAPPHPRRAQPSPPADSSAPRAAPRKSPAHRGTETPHLVGMRRQQLLLPLPSGPRCHVLGGPRSSGSGGVGRSWGPGDSGRPGSQGVLPSAATTPLRAQGQGLVPGSTVLFAGPQGISQAQVTFLGGLSLGHEGFLLSGLAVLGLEAGCCPSPMRPHWLGPGGGGAS